MIVEAFAIKQGWEIIVVDNGRDDVNLLKSLLFDVILMDLQMPIMDGYDTTRLIRGMEKTRHIPIIAMTAYAYEEDQGKCIEAGMDDYISKPVDFNELIKKVRAAALNCHV